MNLVIDMSRSKDSLGRYEFVDPIVSVVGDCEVRHYMEGYDPDSYGRVILSGTPLRDDEYMDHLDKFKWLKGYKKPVLGICAGMQVMAAVHGVKLVKCQEIGMTEIRTIAENPLFEGTFKAYELHNYAVKPSKKFIALAESKDCIQAIRHPKKQHYGALFHPEVRNTDLLGRFLRL